MTAFNLVTPPAVEPVLLMDAKQQARIDTTADDALVTSLITAARQWVENYIGRALITQTWQMTFDTWPVASLPFWDGEREGPVTAFQNPGYVLLPRPPLLAVNSITYYDNSDNATVWDPSNYFVDTVHAPGRVCLRLGAVWPVPMRLTNGIVIQYTAGYGSDGTYVPEAIKAAIRQIVTHWYEHRGEAATNTSRGSMAPGSAGGFNVPLIIYGLLMPYRVASLGA
ncbi:MAG: phage head-tail connector protein [Alphaproteobacteria bacterium]|nr:phage head-tail connector protein [Alphaproteobacteria bacterium]MBV8548709.1 phage head-tail connector protein [Alphaproteobacteria bacterium]